MSITTRLIKYDDAVSHIEDGDVLLFRRPNFPKIGWFIAAYTSGIHSHTGIATIKDGIPYIVEQREFIGGRLVTLKSQVEENPGKIDVYKAKPKIIMQEFDDNGNASYVEKELTQPVRNNIVNKALSITGTPYGWRNIWNIFKGYIPFARFYYGPKQYNDNKLRAYVCSTVVTYSYRTEYVDPCPNISDAKTTPADLSRSLLLDYAFTIGS